MEEIKIKGGLINKPIETQQKVVTPPYPEHLFKLHTLGLFVGARNSGKTNACTLLIKDYIKSKSFNRIFVISPTYDSNFVLHTIPTDENDIYKDSKDPQKSITGIVSKVQEAADEYKEESEYRKVYNRYLNRNYTLQDQLILEKNNHRKPHNIPHPYCCLIIDDMSHTNLYSDSGKNAFINLCLRHRHLAQIGISIFMLVQNFKSGVPRALRQNIQQFFLYKTNDFDLLEDIYSEFANICSYGQFLEVYDTATKEDHHFLTVDPFHPDHSKRFRKNFDFFLKLPQQESIIKIKITKENRKRKRNEDEEYNSTKKIKEPIPKIL